MTARIPFRLTALIFSFVLLAALANSSPAAASLDKAPFGTVDGKQVYIYTLTNANGVVAKVMSYGATLTELDAPDRTGKLDDVVLGFDSLAG